MHKKIWGVTLAVCMCVTMMPNTVMAAKVEGNSLYIREAASETDAADGVSDMEGSGTETAPYRIGSAEQLRTFADMVNGVGGAPNTGLCAVLTRNVDLSGVCGADSGSWSPIGTNANPYTGIFDGAGFAVSGLYYHKPNSSYAGLFGSNAGTIRNLGIAGTDISAGNYTGGVCGVNAGIVTRCYNAGAVGGGKYVGGICGYNKNEVFDCYNMGTVNGSGTSVGGVCGYNKKQVSCCYNTGEVSGKNYVGSICGYNHSKSTFSNCYYLITGTEKGNYGAAMTQQQFASGEVCWLLNGGKSENIVWHQTCGAGFPSFGGKTVYQMQTYKDNGNTKEAVFAYTNDKNRIGAPIQTPSAAERTEASSDDNNDGHVYQEPEWKWKEYKSAKAVFTCLDCGEELTLEASISKKTTEATCGAEGETVYTASVERGEAVYKDKKKVKLKKLGHKPLEPKVQKSATCEEAGIARDCWMCPACKKYFDDEQGTTELPKSQVVIPATKHAYSLLNWSWDTSSSSPSAVAVFVCTNCGKQEEEEGKVTVVSTTAACDKPGDTTYKAVVKFKGTNYEDTKSVNGQPVPHTYGKPVWTWATDYSTATAVISCKKCSHSETVTATITSAKTDSTCETAGQITYTAVVTLDGTEYSDVKSEALPTVAHSYAQPEWEWAADYGAASAVFTCQYCKKSKSVQANIKETKLPGTNCSQPGKIIYQAEVTFEGMVYSDTKEEETTESHTLQAVPAKAATCEDSGNEAYWECSVCRKMFSDAAGTKQLTGIPVIAAVGHKPVYDIQVAYYKCTVCGNKVQVTVLPDGTTTINDVQDEPSLQAEPEEAEEAAEPDSEPEGIQEDAGAQPEPEGTEENAGVQPEPEGTEENAGVQPEPEGIQEDTGAQPDPEEIPANRDGIIEAPEYTERYDIVYPEGEMPETDSVTEGAWEETAVRLPAKASENGAAQTVQEERGGSLWVPVAVLAVLVGAVLIFVLRREEN